MAATKAKWMEDAGFLDSARPFQNIDGGKFVSIPRRVPDSSRVGNDLHFLCRKVDNLSLGPFTTINSGPRVLDSTRC